MASEIVDKIKEFVEEECKKPNSNYGQDAYEHLIRVSGYAEILAKKLNANLEVVKLSALLHDIGSIIISRENHHITGSKIAEKKLIEFDYPAEKIELVKKCILNHRGSVNNKKETIEEQIIADADALDCFDNLDNLFIVALVCENLPRKEARDSVRKKIINSWNKLSFEESREIIKPKFEAAMLLLK